MNTDLNANVLQAQAPGDAPIDIAVQAQNQEHEQISLNQNQENNSLNNPNSIINPSQHDAELKNADADANANADADANNQIQAEQANFQDESKQLLENINEAEEQKISKQYSRTQTLSGMSNKKSKEKNGKSSSSSSFDSSEDDDDESNSDDESESNKSNEQIDSGEDSELHNSRVSDQNLNLDVLQNDSKDGESNNGENIYEKKENQVTQKTEFKNEIKKFVNQNLIQHKLSDYFQMLNINDVQEQDHLRQTSIIDSTIKRNPNLILRPKCKDLQNILNGKPKTLSIEVLWSQDYIVASQMLKALGKRKGYLHSFLKSWFKDQGEKLNFQTFERQLKFVNIYYQQNHLSQETQLKEKYKEQGYLDDTFFEPFDYSKINFDKFKKSFGQQNSIEIFLSLVTTMHQFLKDYEKQIEQKIEEIKKIKKEINIIKIRFETYPNSENDHDLPQLTKKYPKQLSEWKKDEWIVELKNVKREKQNLKIMMHFLRKYNFIISKIPSNEKKLSDSEFMANLDQNRKKLELRLHNLKIDFLKSLDCTQQGKTFFYESGQIVDGQETHIIDNLTEKSSMNKIYSSHDYVYRQIFGQKSFADKIKDLGGVYLRNEQIEILNNDQIAENEQNENAENYLVSQHQQNQQLEIREKNITPTDFQNQQNSGPNIQKNRFSFDMNLQNQIQINYLAYEKDQNQAKSQYKYSGERFIQDQNIDLQNSQVNFKKRIYNYQEQNNDGQAKNITIMSKGVLKENSKPQTQVNNVNKRFQKKVQIILQNQAIKQNLNSSVSPPSKSNQYIDKLKKTINLRQSFTPELKNKKKKVGFEEDIQTNTVMVDPFQYDENIDHSSQENYQSLEQKSQESDIIETDQIVANFLRAEYQMQQSDEEFKFEDLDLQNIGILEKPKQRPGANYWVIRKSQIPNQYVVNQRQVMKAIFLSHSSDQSLVNLHLHYYNYNEENSIWSEILVLCLEMKTSNAIKSLGNPLRMQFALLKSFEQFFMGDSNYQSKTKNSVANLLGPDLLKLIKDKKLKCMQVGLKVIFPKVEFFGGLKFKVLNAETWINIQQHLLEKISDDAFRDKFGFVEQPSFYCFGNENGKFSATGLDMSKFGDSYYEDHWILDKYYKKEFEISKNNCFKEKMQRPLQVLILQIFSNPQNLKSPGLVYTCRLNQPSEQKDVHVIDKLLSQINAKPQLINLIKKELNKCVQKQNEIYLQILKGQQIGENDQYPYPPCEEDRQVPFPLFHTMFEDCLKQCTQLKFNYQAYQNDEPAQHRHSTYVHPKTEQTDQQLNWMEDYRLQFENLNDLDKNKVEKVIGGKVFISPENFGRFINPIQRDIDSVLTKLPLIQKEMQQKESFLVKKQKNRKVFLNKEQKNQYKEFVKKIIRQENQEEQEDIQNIHVSPSQMFTHYPQYHGFLQNSEFKINDSEMAKFSNKFQKETKKQSQQDSQSHQDQEGQKTSPKKRVQKENSKNLLSQFENPFLKKKDQNSKVQQKKDFQRNKNQFYTGKSEDDSSYYPGTEKPKKKNQNSKSMSMSIQNLDQASQLNKRNRNQMQITQESQRLDLYNIEKKIYRGFQQIDNMTQPRDSNLPLEQAVIQSQKMFNDLQKSGPLEEESRIKDGALQSIFQQQLHGYPFKIDLKNSTQENIFGIQHQLMERRGGRKKVKKFILVADIRRYGVDEEDDEEDDEANEGENNEEDDADDDDYDDDFNQIKKYEFGKPIPGIKIESKESISFFQNQKFNFNEKKESQKEDAEMEDQNQEGSNTQYIDDQNLDLNV